MDGVLGKLVTRLALDATSNLIKTTPVDTGWAKANWVPRKGSPATGTVGTREGVTTSGQQAGVADISAGVHIGDTVFISNNVPYIGELNAGHSPQAPAGFVEAALERAVRGLDGVRLS